MAQPAIARTREAPFLLELDLGDACALMELDADEDRAFSIGSSRYADVRVNAIGVSPIEFYLERRRRDVWLVPAYRARPLRVDGTRVTGPTVLDLPAVIEFAGRRAIVRHRYPREERAPASVQRAKPLRREHTAPIPPDALPAVYADALPAMYADALPAVYADVPPVACVAPEQQPEVSALSRPPRSELPVLSQSPRPARPSALAHSRATPRSDPHLWTIAARRPLEALAFTAAVAALAGLAYAGLHLSSSGGAP